VFFKANKGYFLHNQTPNMFHGAFSSQQRHIEQHFIKPHNDREIYVEKVDWAKV